jgi:predicted GNAT family N-acyltransferase
MKDPVALTYTKRVPTLTAFRELRINAGWKLPPDAVIEESLTRTILGVCVETSDGETIGMARVVGDGGIQLFVTDVIVRKDWQHQGVGTRIMELVMKEIGEHAPPGSFVGLFSAVGLEDFYRRFGFIVRPTDKLGAGMVFYPKAERM